MLSDTVFGQCPYGIPNNPGCVPPDAWPQNQTGQIVERQSYWVKTWGAIAVDEKPKNYSFILAPIVGANSERSAKKHALDKCISFGGEKKNCKVILTYFNQCAAFAGNELISATGTAGTVERAGENALNKCKESSGQECKLFYSECSESYLVE